jgi:hypothetical protein
VLEFLSAAWLDALDRAATRSPMSAAGADGRRLIVQQRVHGGPRGDAVYHLVVDIDGLRVREGKADEPGVCFDTDYDTAVAVNTGVESAQAAFMQGRLRIGGDVNELVGNTDLLLAIDDVFAAVRTETSY